MSGANAVTAARPGAGGLRAPQPADLRRWKAVISKAMMNNTTKAMLLSLGNRMDPAGRCQISNETIAEMLGWPHTRSVSRHLKAAFQGGYLVRTAGGYRGFTSVYQATLPLSVPATDRSPTAGHPVDAAPPAVDELSMRRQTDNRSPADGDPKNKRERSEHVALYRSAPADPAHTGEERNDEGEHCSPELGAAPAVRRLTAVQQAAYDSWGETPPIDRLA